MLIAKLNDVIVFMSKYRYFLFVLLIFYILIFVTTIKYDSPSFVTRSRALWNDESLKNHITKNIVEFDDPQPHDANEFRNGWKKSPVFILWSLPFIKIFGAGYDQIRTLAFLTSIVCLGMLYLILRNYKQDRFLNTYFVLLMSCFTFILISRTGTYESLFLCVASLILCMIIHKGSSPACLILAGLFSVLLYWLKATGIVIILVSGFGIVVHAYFERDFRKGLRHAGVYLLSCFVFLIILRLGIDLIFGSAQRSLSFLGVSDILTDKTVSGLYAFVWHFATLFESSIFSRMNVFLLAGSLFSIGLFILKFRRDDVRKIEVIMGLWFVLGMISIGWSNYRMVRLYYMILPAVVFWVSYGLSSCKGFSIQQSYIGLRFVLSSLFFALGLSVVSHYFLMIVYDTWFHHSYVERLAQSPYKIIFFWILSGSAILFFRDAKFKPKLPLIILFTLMLIQNGWNLFSWTRSGNSTIHEANNLTDRILKASGSDMVAGQWSPAFVFDLPGVQSYPIIPGAYNEDILDQLPIRYLFLERGRYETFFEQRYPEKMSGSRVIHSFPVSHWIIDMYDLNSER